MIIDAHAHVHDPCASHLRLLDEAGIDRSVLFITRAHPERATDLPALREELAGLQRRLAGATGPAESWHTALEEHAVALAAHPDRFIGFGSVPLDLAPDEVRAWVQGQIVARGLRGIGELTPPPGQFERLVPVLVAASDHAGLPVVVHGFAPTTRDDLQALAGLARRFGSTPVVTSQLGGLNWLDAIELTVATPNLYLEISTVPVPFAARWAIEILPERTMFGSDAPYGDPVLARQLIERVTPRGEVRERVLAGTAARLFGLG